MFQNSSCSDDISEIRSRMNVWVILRKKMSWRERIIFKDVTMNGWRKMNIGVLWSHSTPDTYFFFSQSTSAAPPTFFNMLSCDKNVDFFSTRTFDGNSALRSQTGVNVSLRWHWIFLSKFFSTSMFLLLWHKKCPQHTIVIQILIFGDLNAIVSLILL